MLVCTYKDFDVLRPLPGAKTRIIKSVFGPRTWIGNFFMKLHNFGDFYKKIFLPQMDCIEVQNFDISLHLQWYHQRNESKTGLTKKVINVGDSASENFNHIMYSFVTYQNKMYKSLKKEANNKLSNRGCGF